MFLSYCFLAAATSARISANATYFSLFIQFVFKLRNDCNYEDFVIVSRAETKTQYLNAIEFYESINIKDYILSSEA